MSVLHWNRYRICCFLTLIAKTVQSHSNGFIKHTYLNIRMIGHNPYLLIYVYGIRSNINRYYYADSLVQSSTSTPYINFDLSFHFWSDMTRPKSCLCDFSTNKIEGFSSPCNNRVTHVIVCHRSQGG